MSQATAKYVIKKEYKSFIARYAWTKLDVNKAYTKEVWLKNGFKEKLLEWYKGRWADNVFHEICKKK